MSRWKIHENDVDIEKMAEVLKIDPVLCDVLANRGIRTKNTAIKFLNPKLEYLHDMASMAGVADAVEIISTGIEKTQAFCIFGDYDADGITSTVITHKALEGLGAKVGYYIPHRSREGYGPSIAAFEKLAQDYQILIIVDSGIAALDEIARAVELGLKVIVIDHHEAQTDEAGNEALPAAHAIIDPKQANCAYPFKQMCAGGLSYKFAMHLYKELGKGFKDADEALIFAMIATFCDIVDLVDENRIIAKNGLLTLNTKFSTNIGLNALVMARNLEYNSIDDFAVGFVLGPCINASGRLDTAELAVELFLTKDKERAAELAAQLVELNDKRKEMCAKFVEEAVQNLPPDDELDDIILIYHPEIHESIAGIVAGRVKEHTGRPTIVFAKSHDVASGKDFAKGSARSIEAYNIFEHMQNNKELFLRFGGHALAAGVSLDVENIDILRKRLNDASTLTKDDFDPIIYAEKWVQLDDITFELASHFTALAPFGKANKEPMFFARDIVTEQVQILGQNKQTLKLVFRTEQGRKINAIAFKAVEKFADYLRKYYSDEVADGFFSGKLRNLNIKMDCAFNVRINTYMGNSSLQLVITDFRTSSQ